jgi:hypothetical protein
VFDQESNKAIVFFGVNNPHSTVEDINNQGLILCPNQSPNFCSDLGWQFRQRNDPAKGFIYCCSYQVPDVIKLLKFVTDSRKD